MNLILSGKNNEVADKIPKRYRNAIFNSIIAKSMTDGSLLKEVSLYLSTDELDDFLNETNLGEVKVIKNTIKEKIDKPYKPKVKKQEIKSKEENFFSGFDN